MCTAEIGDDQRGAESFGRELAKQIPALRTHAKFLTRHGEAAADLTQETLAKAWAARSRFAAGTNLRAWLFTIMRNQFHSEMRRAWRQMPWDQELAERIPASRDEQSWSIELRDAARAIGTLSKRQREALILAGFGGLSSEDVGEILRCRVTSVKSRVCRARQTMQSMLDGKVALAGKRKGAGCNAIDDLVQQLQTLTGNVRPAAGGIKTGSVVCGEC
jgi:RNA polymerase sigma-70 factor, ECF subfamily